MFRVGIGYDIHRLVAGRKLILGGIEIPFEYGLEGHSDGDSLVHAIADAFLGASGLGDIGRYFPSSDPELAGVDSMILLSRVADMLAKRGCKIENVDATICAERPKMAPHILEMSRRISSTLGIDADRVSIKAKTNEGLDAVGRGEAISAHAIALISCGHKT